MLHGVIIEDNVNLSGVFRTKNCLYISFPIMSLYNAACLISQKIRKQNCILWSDS